MNIKNSDAPAFPNTSENMAPYEGLSKLEYFALRIFMASNPLGQGEGIRPIRAVEAVSAAKLLLGTIEDRA